MNAVRARRRTVVVHTKLAGHIARVAAARADENGVQIMTMGQLAARLAGGLLRPVDPDSLRDAVRGSAIAAARLTSRSLSIVLRRATLRKSE